MARTPPPSRSWSPGTGRSTANGSKASTCKRTASCWPRRTNRGRTTSRSAGRWYYLENAREFLDQPGEWYCDGKTGTLSYWPRSGEDMTRVQVVAPILQRVLAVKGTPQKPVRNLHFKGIRFECTDWRLPKEGYMGVQASHYGNVTRHVPAAVCFAWAEHCSVEDGVLAGLGGCGMEIGMGCRENLIQGNGVFDVSADGILVSGPNSEAEVPKNDHVSNNHVYRCRAPAAPPRPAGSCGPRRTPRRRARPRSCSRRPAHGDARAQGVGGVDVEAARECAIPRAAPRVARRRW